MSGIRFRVRARRRRVRLTGSILAPLLMLAFLAWLPRCTADTPGREHAGSKLRIGYIGPPRDESGWAHRGAELGADEASRAAELVGRSIELLVAEAPENTAEAAIELRSRGAFAIIGGFDEASCRQLARAAEEHRFIFLNIGCRADVLREDRAANTFHIEASHSMYDAQAAQFAALSPVEAMAELVLWHGGLGRYGAAQLNERFKRRFGAPPEPLGWAAWMAMKVAAEAALRTRRTDARRLARFLESDSARFDGHKGEPLVFDRATGQLLQPLYPSPTRPTHSATMAASTVPMRTAGAAHGEATSLSAAAVAAGRYAFVSNEGSGDVTVIDTDARRAVSTIPVGARPRGIRVSRDGRHLYVALSDDAPRAEGAGDAIAAIDLERLSVTERYRAGTDPEQFAVSPDGGRLFASNEDAGTTSVLDLGTGEVIATLVVGIEPEGVGISPDGRWVYVTAETSNTVSVIDSRDNRVVSSFLVDVRPRAATFSPDGAHAYVSNEISGTVSVIDVAGHRVIGTVTLKEPEAKPVGVVVSPDGRRVYAANGHAGGISVIDAATNRVVDTVPVGRRPWGIALTPDGRYAYVANGGSDDVSVVDLESSRVVTTVPVGKRPWGVAIASGGRQANTPD